MSYEAILFDMDGVIIDTHHAVTQFWEEVAGAHGVRISRADFVQNVYGCPANRTLDVLFGHLGSEERRAVIDKMADYEINQTYTEVKGIRAFLGALRRRGVPTALVTSGERWKVDTVLGQLGLEEMFAAQVISADIERGKPDPECYLLGARRVGKPPEKCIVFEDSVSGTMAGAASGALCVGVSLPGMEARLLEAGARYVVPDFTPVGLLDSALRIGQDVVPLGQGYRATRIVPGDT